jgi:hypothetical protein
MAFFEDLTPCTYFDHWQERLLAIGWLQPGMQYTKGPVTEEFFHHLARLLLDPWQPFIAAGHEPCGYCRFSKGSASFKYRDMVISVGSANLFVPGNGCIYVAPSLIAHYIDSHEYKPPIQFQEAVISCPEMKSVAYFKKLKELGVSLKT